MGNIDLELAAKKSIQRTRKLSLADLGFKIDSSDDSEIEQPEDIKNLSFYNDTDLFDYSDDDEYARMNFIVPEEDEAFQSDFDTIMHKYQNNPLYLSIYFLELYQRKGSRAKLSRLAQELYEQFNNQFNLQIDTIKTDLVQAIYIVLKYSDLIFNLVAIIVANNIIQKYSKFDERNYSEGLTPYLNDFFDATDNLNLSKQLALAFIYYTDNVDRANVTNKNMKKLLENISNTTVKLFLYNLFMNNTMKSLLDLVMFIQEASDVMFKSQVAVYTVDFIKRKLAKDKE